jgi:peroxiredoxin
MTRTVRRATWIALLVGSAVTAGPQSPSPPAPVAQFDDELARHAQLGRPIAHFTLRDHRGKTHSLSDHADKKLVVVAFLGTGCPLAKLYARRLAELAEAYRSRGVVFLGIDANAQDSLADIAVFVRSQPLPFPMLKDPDHAVADALGAVRTPEVFVLDERRVVRYWGRIDDQFGIGVHQSQPRQRYLAAALDDLLARRCVVQPVVASVGCHIGRVPRATPRGQVTYHCHIRPLLEKRCLECHRAGEVAPFALTEYRDVAAWSTMIREVVEEGRMPPWHASPQHGRFGNDARLDANEKQLLFTWIDNGCPEGDRATGPAPRKFLSGWRIPQPDQVVFMAEQPFAVPAEGDVDYQYFVADPGFTEDKYVRAAEVRPGSRSVVHHALVAVIPPGEDPTRLDTLGALLDYAPGMPPTILPAGHALRIRAGSKFLFQMHYTPNGTAHTDRSYLGLVFVDPKSVASIVRGGAVINQAIDIPPGAANYRLSAEQVLAEPIRLLSLSPHMHLRGRSFRFEAHYPDGRRVSTGNCATTSPSRRRCRAAPASCAALATTTPPTTLPTRMRRSMCAGATARPTRC